MPTKAKRSKQLELQKTEDNKINMFIANELTNENNEGASKGKKCQSFACLFFRITNYIESNII